MRQTLSFGTPAPRILTPCIGVCTLAGDGLCEGCLRSGEEIAGWSRWSDEQRQHWIDQVQPLRRHRRG